MQNFLTSFFKSNSVLIFQLFLHLLILFFVIKCINKLYTNLKNKLSSEGILSNNKLHLLFIVSRIVKILCVIVIIASFLQSNGYSLTSLMTGLGITGLAIGFAAKESLSCILGSFAIMLDNIYKIGDYVEINGYEGVVEAINFHSTKLRTANNALITIPNNIPADSIVQNRSDAKYFRLIQNFDIEYNTSDEKISQALSIIKQYCNSCEHFRNDYKLFISELGENSITIQLIANTITNDWLEFLSIKSCLLQNIIKSFRQNDINFAFPSRTVYLKNEN